MIDNKTWNNIIDDARINSHKSFEDLTQGHDLSKCNIEKLKEIIYDARQDREFDYISAANKVGIIKSIISVSGYRGKNFVEAGYVYAPYIPLQMSPIPEIAPEIDLHLKSTPITVKPRKLRCKWSIEQMADLSTYHGLNTEKEITDMWAKEIQKSNLKQYADKQINPEYYGELAIKPVTTGSMVY